MKLVVLHHHLRPGGIRRVIELATPPLAAQLRPRITEVVLAVGEAPDERWMHGFERALGACPVACQVEPTLGYLAEQSGPARAITRQLRRCFTTILESSGPKHAIVWAHNLGLARNLLLARELASVCADRAIPLVLHHHDWWFDNRWARWAEIRRAGFRTLAQAADAVFPRTPNVRHVAINQADASILARHFPDRSGWLPNLAEPAPPPPPTRVRRARRWLRDQLGEPAPVWLLPARMLRRKNIAEALLLTRWLRPEAWLVTTGPVSSADEIGYADRLTEAACQHNWRLRLRILANERPDHPTVPDLIAASEVVLLPSLQEGFGLPYLEAVAAQRPLIARALPNVAPDLAQFGFRFPHYYDELWIHPQLLDWCAERRRQQGLFARWRRQLPGGCRRLVGPLWFQSQPANPAPIPFGRLTLTGQLEVLAQPLDRSWQLCAPLNPFLRLWREQAAQGGLRPTAWPPGAARWLSGRAYARQFQRVLDRDPGGPSPASASLAAQAEFIRRSLRPDNLYPLTWAQVT